MILFSLLEKSLPAHGFPLQVTSVTVQRPDNCEQLPLAPPEGPLLPAVLALLAALGIAPPPVAWLPEPEPRLQPRRVATAATHRTRFIIVNPPAESLWPMSNILQQQSYGKEVRITVATPTTH